MTDLRANLAMAHETIAALTPPPEFEEGASIGYAQAAHDIWLLKKALARMTAEKDEWKRLAIAGEITAKLHNITEARAEAAGAKVSRLIPHLLAADKYLDKGLHEMARNATRAALADIRGGAGMIKVTLDDVMGTDLGPVMDAKVSFDADASVCPLGWEHVAVSDTQSRDQPILTDRHKGLIRFLVRGMTSDEYEALQELAKVDPAKALWRFRTTPIHAAPFGHCYLKFTIEAPVFVARQLVKHEYMRMSEVSRRYIKGLPVYYAPDNWASIAAEVKQGAGDPLPAGLNAEVGLIAQNAIDTADRAYQVLLKHVAPEEARMILPLCHMTRWRWSGSLDAVMNMCNLRLDGHAQSQAREVARQVGEYAKRAFPQSWASYVEGDI